jgi:hypothetical protein
MSSDFSQLPDFNQQQQQQQYQQYNPPPKKNRGGCLGLSLLAVIGGSCGLILLCCVGCVAAVYLIFQEPTIVAQAWGSGLTDPVNYDTSDLLVCSGSQAETYTSNLASEQAYFETGTFLVGTSSGDNVDVSGTLVRDNNRESWTATLTIESGGVFGRCVSQVDEN